MNSRKKYIKRVCVSVLILLVITMVIYLLINTGISKIEVGKVYKAYVYDYDNRLTSGYKYIELIDEDSFVIFSDADIEPNPKDSFDGLYDYLSFLSVTMIQGRYSFYGGKYYFYTENIATADYFDFEEWEKFEPKEYKENYNQYILDDRIILEKELNGYILTNDFGDGETRYLLKEVVDKDIPQSIEEFKQEYAKNY
jgi:hypothetical protein